MNLNGNAFKPINFWSWNGLMEEEEVRWQIKEFKNKGFGGFFIHSRAGRLISYMGEQWMKACGYAIDEAEKQGLDVWLYDEDGWPSGFAGGLVNGCGKEFWAKTLSFESELPKNSVYEILADFKRVNNSYKRVDNDTAQADLYCIVKMIPTYVDLMNPDVTKEFIKVTHEVYKNHFSEFFGNTIKGIFTDEPQLIGKFPWSSALQKRYLEEYGDDLLDVIWCLNEKDGYTDIKYRYRYLTNLLFLEGYVRQVNDWCNANNIIFTGHFSSEDGLVEQSTANGGVMPFYMEMGMPGIDYLGNRYTSVNLMKQVASVAHIRNIPYILSESFGCSGWNVSFKELMSVAGWQAVFGINTLCMHLSAYTISGRRKRDYPAFFSYQEPWWNECDLLTGAIKKLNSYLSDGERITDVAVVHPMRSAWALGGEESKYISSDFRELQNHLVDLHIDFDLIDESEIAKAKIDSGKLTVGAVSYGLVIVPRVFTLAESTVKMLDLFSENNGSIYFIGERPQTVEGSSTNPFVSMIKGIKALDIQNSHTILQKVFRAYKIDQPYNLLDMDMFNEVKGLASRYIKNENVSYLYCFNPQSGATIKTYLKHKNLCEITKIDIYSSNTSVLPADFDGEYTYTLLEIESDCGVLLQIKEDVFSDIKVAKNITTQTLNVSGIDMTDLNCLALDIGKISFDSDGYSEVCNVVNNTDEIYRRIAESKSDMTLKVEYEFLTDFEKMPDSMYLAFEKSRYVAAQINGHNVETEVDWFIDKEIIKFNILDYVINGLNKVTLRYIIPNTNKVNNLSEKFESERNRFFYNVEPENIYIIGDFDLLCSGKIAKKPNVITVNADNTFVLKDKTEKKYGELTTQGLWFYRGDAVYETDVDFSQNGRYFLSLKGMKGIFAVVYSDEKKIGYIVSENDRVELTDYMKIGTNKIRIELKGSNRNLMGPHHHITGEPCFVGPSTFSGIAGFEDFISPEINTGDNTYTDSYSFVPFGIEEVILTVEQGVVTE